MSQQRGSAAESLPGPSSAEVSPPSLFPAHGSSQPASTAATLGSGHVSSHEGHVTQLPALPAPPGPSSVAPTRPQPQDRPSGRPVTPGRLHPPTPKTKRVEIAPPPEHGMERGHKGSSGKEPEVTRTGLTLEDRIALHLEATEGSPAEEERGKGGEHRQKRPSIETPASALTKSKAKKRKRI